LSFFDKQLSENKENEGNLSIFIEKAILAAYEQKNHWIIQYKGVKVTNVIHYSGVK
jgi:hypothetical protein|tara:strand:- start:452 stop:619 length:168 start_codon:yes stop_codon:yes gene_type:complete